jgi:hypothetical protein
MFPILTTRAEEPTVKQVFIGKNGLNQPEQHLINCRARKNS